MDTMQREQERERRRQEVGKRAGKRQRGRRVRLQFVLGSHSASIHPVTGSSNWIAEGQVGRGRGWGLEKKRKGGGGNGSGVMGYKECSPGKCAGCWRHAVLLMRRGGWLWRLALGCFLHQQNGCLSPSTVSTFIFVSHFIRMALEPWNISVWVDIIRSSSQQEWTSV